MNAVWGFSVNPLELMVRGTLVYCFLFVLFRFVLRRDAGSMGIADILLVVLIADASQNAMSGEYRTVPDGFVLVGTLVGWNWLLDWASWRFNAVRRIVEPPPVVLVRHGRLVGAALRREQITVPDLMANLREHGIDKLAQVHLARMESDGSISVIRVRDGGPQPERPTQRRSWL